MKNIFRYKPLFFIALIVLILSAFVPMKEAAPKFHKSWSSRASVAQTNIDVYLVDIIVLNLFDIDLNAGTYSMDFYLMLTCQDAPCENEPQWDILNSTSGLEVSDQGVNREFAYYEYRVKADLIGRVDYTFYPFDYLYVDVYLEDKMMSSDALSYQYSSISVDSILFNPAGWVYKGLSDSGYTYVIQYGDPDTSYDRLDMWLFLERDWFGAFMKTVFAAIVIVLIGMLSYLMKADATTERLALTSSTLIAIVLYHISLVAGVPATGYLTFIDKFMIWTYLIVFLSLVISVLMMVYVNSGRVEKAEKLHSWTRWAVPSLWVFLMIWVFVTELTLPYSVLVSAANGVYTWPQNLGWLAKLLDVFYYFPENYFS